ncbi:MAG: hypothetical protein JNM62_10210 [Flavobacteriales bacterium]|nr:hypothetical protein [Flavobacteriales bacterium]
MRMLRSFVLLVLMHHACAALVGQEMMIYGVVKSLPDKQFVEHADITVEDEHGMALDATTSGDSGVYELGLLLERIYTIRYQAHGALPKHLVVDLRNVDATEAEREGGWGMNIDVTLYPPIDGVPDSLIALPFGKAAWNAADTSFAWNMAYTEGVRDAWAPWIARIGDARVEQPGKTWSTRTSVVALLALCMFAWSAYLSDRFDRWADSAERVRTALRTVLVLIALLGGWAWLGWSLPGWPGWWAAMAATLAVVLAAALLVKAVSPRTTSTTDEPLPREKEARVGRLFNRLKLFGGIPALVCAFILWRAMDRTLRPEHDLLRHAAIALALLLVLRLVLGKALQRALVRRADRTMFWIVCTLLALVIVPGTIHFVDQELVVAQRTQRAEITGLYETNGRRGRVTYSAHVLVDGREKELRMGFDEWSAATDHDALDLHIGEGPLGIQHIVEWHLVQRAPEADGE